MKALIVDGEELFRLSVKEVASVAANPTTILEASSEREFLTLTASEEDLGLIVIHCATLGREGQDCVKLAKRLYPKAALVMIEDRPQTGYSTVCAGVIKVMRSSSVVQMVAAIRRALGLPMEGLPKPSLKAPDISALVTSAGFDDSPIDLSRLSFRQKQILAMAADGLPNKEIAARLEIAEGTVKAHMHAIFKVMGVTNRTQAVIRFGAVGKAQPAPMMAAASF